MNNRELGEYGENIAIEYLRKNGYTILERNKHFSKNCEIDIIALDSQDTLVFIEVKTRTSEFLGSPLEAITPKKLRNIRLGVYSYLNELNSYKNYRIDAISIVLKPKQTLEHVKNI